MLKLVGDKWSVLVVGVLGNGPLRFSAIKRTIEAISQRMLTRTLRGLERDGLVTRTVTPPIPPGPVAGPVPGAISPKAVNVSWPVRSDLGEKVRGTPSRTAIEEFSPE